MKVTDEMVTRFLGWKLPQDFLPDCGISFTPYMVGEPLRPLWPIGTNLLHAGQARAMLEHVLGEATDGDAAQRELAAWKQAANELVANWSKEYRDVDNLPNSVRMERMERILAWNQISKLARELLAANA